MILGFIKRSRAEKKARRKVADDWRTIVTTIAKETFNDSDQEQKEAEG